MIDGWVRLLESKIFKTCYFVPKELVSTCHVFNQVIPLLVQCKALQNSIAYISLVWVYPVIKVYVSKHYHHGNFKSVYSIQKTSFFNLFYDKSKNKLGASWI